MNSQQEIITPLVQLENHRKSRLSIQENIDDLDQQIQIYQQKINELKESKQYRLDQDQSTVDQIEVLKKQIRDENNLY